MSERFGRWERSILGLLDVNGSVYVRDILGEGYSASDYSAAMRAARLLRGRGLLILKIVDRHKDGRRFVLATKEVK